MTAKVKKELADILAKYELDPKEALWDCHGTWVMYHKHCELIAAKAGIRFDAPQIIEAKSGDKVVAICATGHIGAIGAADERVEWSIGEAAPANNKNAYPYAMAEKRAKDRVILKLVGLSAYIYSEDEADDFKDAKPENVAAKVAAPSPSPSPSPSPPPAAIDAFWKRPSYEIPGNDLLVFATKFVKATELAPTEDSLLKLEDDNGSHVSAIKNGSATEWTKVQAALSAARKRLNPLAA